MLATSKDTCYLFQELVTPITIVTIILTTDTQHYNSKLEKLCYE